jgi:hypothetical protein
MTSRLGAVVAVYPALKRRTLKRGKLRMLGHTESASHMEFRCAGVIADGEPLYT